MEELCRMNSFIKKKKAMVKVEFEEAIEQSKKLLLPIVDSISKDEVFQSRWNKNKQEWM